MKNGEWQRVMFTAECDPDGEGWCSVRNCDPAECGCVGPMQDSYEYRVLDGILYGRPGAVERLRKSLERVLPFVGVTPVEKSEREKLASATRFALSVLEDLDAPKNPLLDLG